jgi:hypothetical protein
MLFATRQVPLRRSGLQEAKMDPKLAMLFLLIGAVIALSNLSDENLGRMRQQLSGRRWRQFVPGWRK